jgi:hypothetical protein
METGTEITHARILNSLLDEGKKKFHTEIKQPVPMAILDAAQRFVEDEFGSDAAVFWDEIRDWIRTNYVAKDRKRAEEIIRGVQAELQREERELRDRMLGTMGR